MVKDPRYKTVKILIEGGHLSEFRQIFESIPKTIVAQDMGTNYKRLVRLADEVTQFKVDDLVTLAAFFDVDMMAIFKLVSQQINNDKKARRKK